MPGPQLGVAEQRGRMRERERVGVAGGDEQAGLAVAADDLGHRAAGRGRRAGTPHAIASTAGSEKPS